MYKLHCIQLKYTIKQLKFNKDILILFNYKCVYINDKKKLYANEKTLFIDYIV